MSTPSQPVSHPPGLRRGPHPSLTALRRWPVTVPALAAVALFISWAARDGAQPLTTWGPGTLALIGLLGVCAVVLPGRWREAPRPVRVALIALAAFTAWSALSILWADDRGAAWEGADRTLLYLVVFALFALWPQGPSTGAWVLGAWTAGLMVLAVITLIRVPTVGDTASLFSGGRLSEPAGYPNAAAATWLMAFWPAVAFAASGRVPWVLRGLLAAGAVVLASLALLSQSRGALLGVPITAVLFLAFVPGRVRHILVLVPIAAAVAATARKVLDAGDAVAASATAAQGALDTMVRDVFVSAAIAGLLVAGVAFVLHSRRPSSAAAEEQLRRVGAALAALVVLVVLVAGVVRVGNPSDRLDNAWTSFKGGYSETAGGSDRLSSGLGSNRYDFYRVALNVFRDHPVAGVGADNYFQDYLRAGRSPETPRYPHSLELRTLAQTGLVGSALLLAALAAALAGAWNALRADRLGGAVAGGAVMVFVYWVVHGSADWFWEWAGLGAPAFAFLGLACALAPRRREPDPAARFLRARAAKVAGISALVIAGLAVASPWLAEREITEAGSVFARRPLEAYDRLDRAAQLDPLSARPQLVAGSIALRFGDLPRAQREFEEALRRSPRDQYATLELGAVASVLGDRARAERLLRRAVELSPKDPLAREALSVVRAGGSIDVSVLNQRILQIANDISS